MSDLLHLQERKMELHKAIVTVEQGGSADGLLQVHVFILASCLLLAFSLWILCNFSTNTLAFHIRSELIASNQILTSL